MYINMAEPGRQPTTIRHMRTACWTTKNTTHSEYVPLVCPRSPKVKRERPLSVTFICKPPVLFMIYFMAPLAYYDYSALKRTPQVGCCRHNSVRIWPKRPRRHAGYETLKFSLRWRHKVWVKELSVTKRESIFMLPVITNHCHPHCSS